MRAFICVEKSPILGVERLRRLLVQDDLVQGRPNFYEADPVASPLTEGRRNARQGVGRGIPRFKVRAGPSGN